jgi:hypothetical protein
MFWMETARAGKRQLWQTQLELASEGLSLVKRGRTLLQREQRREVKARAKVLQHQRACKAMAQRVNERFHKLRVFQLLRLPEFLFDWFQELDVHVNVRAKPKPSPTYWRYEVDVGVGNYGFEGSASYEMCSIHIQGLGVDFDELREDWFESFFAQPELVKQIFAGERLEQNWFELQTSGFAMDQLVCGLLLEGLRRAVDAEVEVSDHPWEFCGL